MSRAELVSPNTEQHQAFCRLYELARQVHRGSGRRPDLWSGELRVRAEGFGSFGSFNTVSGAMTLTADMLHGLMSETAQERGDALATLLHETLHAMRHEETRASAAAVVRGRDAVALDEGLVEYVTKLRLPEYARLCGTEGAQPTQHAHIGPNRAVEAVLNFAVGQEKAGALAEKLMHESCDLDFHGLASAIVDSHAGDVMGDPHRQAAAVKAVQSVLRRAPWGESMADARRGADIAQHLPDLLKRKLDQIRAHHDASTAPFRDRGSHLASPMAQSGSTERQRAVSGRLRQAQVVNEPSSPPAISTRETLCGAAPCRPIRLAFDGVANPRGAVSTSPSGAASKGTPGAHPKHQSQRGDDGLAE